MKKVVILLFQAVMVFSLQAQKVSNYTYNLENGIKVNMEQCWNQVWVDQRFDAVQASDPVPLALSVRTMGDLTSGSSFKLYSSGKEIKVQGAKPGTYSMKVLSNLSGEPGNLSFDIDNIIIKPQSKTTVSVILYNYQVIIDEAPGTQKGLSSFTSKVERFKGNPESSPTCGIAAFYSGQDHNTPVPSGPAAGSKDGSIKPGTYDVMVTLGPPGRSQKVWLENFVMKPDMKYNITTNLNAGIIEYAGTNREVKYIHLYPAGIADRQNGKAVPDRNYEMIRCETQGVATACPPGSYDVLLNIGNGAKYEWRKNIVVRTGSRTQVK